MTAARSDGWDLIEAAQAGDRDAFGRLYSRYAPGVSRFVGSRLRDRALAEDLTSETFARALRRIDSVSDQGRDAGAWFTTIARNLITDHVKSSRVQRETVTAEVADASSDDRQEGPEQAVIRRDTAADVRRRVAQLPTDQQQCLRLRYFQELSVAETAAVMGRNEGAVKALAHRGLVGLRASMANDARRAPREAVPDPLDRARRAVAEVAQHRADHAHQDRARQLARWHTDDRAAERHQGLALVTDGAAR